MPKTAAATQKGMDERVEDGKNPSQSNESELGFCQETKEPMNYGVSKGGFAVGCQGQSAARPSFSAR